MGNFNYKRWLTENKYGKPNINYVDINEQQIGGSEIFFGCQKDDNGDYGYTPMIPFYFSSSLINQNDWIERLRYNEYDGGNQNSWPSQLVNNGVLEPAWSGSITNTEEGTITLQSGGTYQICPSGSINTSTTSNQDSDILEPEPEPTQTYGNTGSTLDGDTCPENGMSIVLTNPGGSFNFNMYCVTVNGQTPQVGDTVIGNNGNQGEILQVAEPGSGEITGTGGNAIFNLQLVSSGTPDPEDMPDPEGMPEPEGQPTPQGLAAPNTGPQPQGKKKPMPQGKKKPMSKPRLKKEATPKLAKNTSRLKQIKEIIRKEVNKLNKLNNKK